MRRSAIVIGYGSIGARHARLLEQLDVAVRCVTRNRNCPFPSRETLAEAIAAEPADLIVIANATSDHISTLRELEKMCFAGPVLVEKPLTGSQAADAIPDGINAFVAYNLRFHPLVSLLRQQLDGARLLGASFHAGQYLPDWRPGTDYRQSYSANRISGGGVLRDLSHELDLALWFCGSWRRVAALMGHFGPLEIETDDTASLLLETDKCPMVMISVNYLDRKPQREIKITAERNGYVFDISLDLVGGRLTVDGKTTDVKPERDATYRAQLEALLSGQTGTLCSLHEGKKVDGLIIASELASSSRIWIGREGEKYW